MEKHPIESKGNYILSIKDGKGFSFVQPFIDTETPFHKLEKYSFIDFHSSQSGGLISSILEGIVHVYAIKSENKIELLKKFDLLEQAVKTDFSPSGRYLTIVQKPQIQNNLKIISLDDFSVFMELRSNHHPGDYWPQIKYSVGEEYAFKKTSPTVEIYKLEQTSETPKPIGSIPSVVDYEIAEVVDKSKDLNEIAIVAVRVKTIENKKEKGKTSKSSVISIYKISSMEKPVIENTCSLAHRTRISISPNKKYAIVNSISDESSSTSYYGNASLYYVNLLSGKFQKFSNLKEGKFHDFAFTRTGEQFIIIAGHQPSSTYIYDSEKCLLIKELCNDKKVNSIRISPDNRLVMLAGLDNLNGNVEIFTLCDTPCISGGAVEKWKQIGSCVCYGSFTVEWSEDSRHFVSTVLSPYLRVDNDFRVFTYNGEEICSRKFQGEIYQCSWVPVGMAYKEFSIEISQKHLEKLKKLKEKKPGNTWSLPGSIGGAKTPVGIPGAKKKK